MARISHEEAERYGGGGAGDWFKLKDHGDVARVQFMCDSMEQIPTITAHRVKVGDYERDVDCLRTSFDAPLEDCPLCAAGIPARAIRYIPLYQHDDGKAKVWERGKQFLATMQGLMSRYAPLSSYVFEIERHGVAKDTQTRYNIFPMDSVEPFDLTDVEIPEIVGHLVLSKTVVEMETYIATGKFPEADARTASVGRTGPAPAPGVTRRVPSAPAPRAGRTIPVEARDVAVPQPRATRGSTRARPIGRSEDTEVY